MAYGVNGGRQTTKGHIMQYVKWVYFQIYSIWHWNGIYAFYKTSNAMPVEINAHENCIHVERLLRAIG